MSSDLVGGFDWDDGNRIKCEKHGVTLAEIEAVFQHTHRIAPDIDHSSAEIRYLAIGSGGGLRPIFVAFTLRDGPSGLLIRPVSARYMHRKEIEHYDKSVAQTDQ